MINLITETRLIMKSLIELKSKPYIIAELSSNHCKNIEITIKSIEAAARTGADAIKTQLYTPDSLTIPNRSFSPVIEDKKVLGLDKNFMIFMMKLPYLMNGILRC